MTFGGIKAKLLNRRRYLSDYQSSKFSRKLGIIDGLASGKKDSSDEFDNSQTTVKFKELYTLRTSIIAAWYPYCEIQQ